MLHGKMAQIRNTLAEGLISQAQFDAFEALQRQRQQQQVQQRIGSDMRKYGDFKTRLQWTNEAHHEGYLTKSQADCYVAAILAEDTGGN